MKKVVLSVLIVFFSIFAGIAATSSPNNICKSPGLINLATPIELDSLALVALYNQCNGTNWTQKGNWLTGPLTTWQGITVENDRVVILNLGDQTTSCNLAGPLPSELSDLTMLRTLNLSNNQLTGNLPETLSALVNVTYLNLSNNKFSGTLPDSWAGLKNLQILELWSNQLSGNLPVSWAALVNMTWLVLGANQLTGTLPESWSALVNLEGLWLQQNKLSGALPDGWSAFGKIFSLMLESNQLSGSVPLSWQAMTKLQTFYLHNNQISGLPQLTGLSRLISMVVYNNLLDFAALEPNIGMAAGNFSYSPQFPVGQSATILKVPGEQFTISVTVGGLNNKYQWYKDGVLIPGALEAQFVIPAVISTDAGEYTCQITNTVVTDLTLNSNPITLNVENRSFDTYSDSLALVALYNQCNGVNWTKKTNWLTGPLNTWQGVTIENKRVVELDLGDPNISVGLQGSLPNELSNLTEIRYLNFRNNQLSGNLPASWSALVNLNSLELGINRLSGVLPDSWSSLVNLRYLSIFDNQLTGALPGGWSSMVNLQDLFLHDNKLSGILPPEWSGLIKLNQFLLMNNQITGSLPANWSALINLSNLQIYQTNLTGVLPESWSSLINLQTLALYGNQITGTLPESWSALIKLQSLSLGNNPLTGSLPASWAALVNLKTLDFYNDKFIGTLPPGWSALVNLQTIILYNNQISGIVPESWKALTNLQNLWIHHNQISGLPDLSGLTKLVDIEVQDNMLDFGSIEPNIGVPKNTFNYSPQAIIGLPAIISKNPGEQFTISVTVGGQSNKYQWYKNGDLIPGATGTEFTISAVGLANAGDYTCHITNTVATQLTLTSNPVTLRIGNPPPVMNTDSLALVALYNQCNGSNWSKKSNWLTGALDTWQGVTVVNGRVVALDLGDTSKSIGLEGTLPSELSGLTEIITLNFDNNKLTGNLPESWSALIKLEDLRLGVNQFTGNLPLSWSSLVHLQVLDLGYNQLAGTLPESWITLSNLTQLNLGSNTFSGSLPIGWVNLINLKELWLGNNQLTGNLPSNWYLLSKLEHLFLGNNKLDGSLPLSWSAMINLQFLQLSDNKFSGPLPGNWSELVQLKYLELGNNQLTETLPLSWKALVNLFGLSLRDNKLSGSLPDSWSALANLNTLELNNNQFTGTMPASWQAFINLGELTISNNQLTGLPLLSGMTKLSTLSVQNNALDFGAIEPNISVPKSSFNYSPQANVGQTATLLRNPGTEFRINVATSGQSNKYQWLKDGIAIQGATSAELLIPSVTSADGGVYTLEITNTVATRLTLKSNPTTLKITASGPVANAGTNQTVTTGTTVTLNSTGSTHDAGKTLTYQWIAPYGITLSSTTAANPTFTAPHVTLDVNYTFSLVVNDGTTDSLPVEVVITVTNTDLTPCEKDPIVDLYLAFTATPTTLDSRHRMLTCAIPFGLGLNYDWDLGDGSVDHGIIIQHNYDISNTIMKYTVKVTVSNSSGCVRTASKVIDAIPFIPNVFSPNGDGINDVFMPDVDLQIFDRNGTIYYKGTSGWDGTYKGRVAEQDTYFYLIEFTDGNNNLTSRKGFITLVK